MRLVLCPQYYIVKGCGGKRDGIFAGQSMPRSPLATLRTQILSSTFRHFHFSFAREKIPPLFVIFLSKMSNNNNNAYPFTWSQCSDEEHEGRIVFLLCVGISN